MGKTLKEFYSNAFVQTNKYVRQTRIAKETRLVICLPKFSIPSITGNRVPRGAFLDCWKSSCPTSTGQTQLSPTRRKQQQKSLRTTRRPLRMTLMRRKMTQKRKKRKSGH